MSDDQSMALKPGETLSLLPAAADLKIRLQTDISLGERSMGGTIEIETDDVSLLPLILEQLGLLLRDHLGKAP